MTYSIRRKLVGQSELFQDLKRESGNIYSQTVTFFWRTVRKKGIWLKPKSLLRLFNSDKMHAHSADHSVQSFFNSLKSWSELRKSDPNARPPRRRKYFFPVTWKNTAIRIKNGNLILSNGRNQQPVVIENWQHKLPIQAMLRWTGTENEIIFTYTTEDEKVIETGDIVGLDIGQIHMVACSDGLILNGKLLRSLRQWFHKKESDLQYKIDHKKKGSRQWKRLKVAKAKFLKTAANKTKDILHKLTTGLVATMKRKGVSTLVIGDLTGYRLDNDCGSKRNQENHSWLYHQITWITGYKCKRSGIKMVLQEESYTTKQCPACFNRKKPTGRNYKCKCGFVGHRDIVGATNIRSKYLGYFGIQVVAEMAPAFGIRFNPHINVASGFQWTGYRSEESTPIYRL